MNWAIKEFSLREVDVSKFCMNGRDLCRLTRDEFLKLAPAYNGDILMAHLCVLRKGKRYILVFHCWLSFNNVKCNTFSVTFHAHWNNNASFWQLSFWKPDSFCDHVVASFQSPGMTKALRFIHTRRWYLPYKYYIGVHDYYLFVNFLSF